MVAQLGARGAGDGKIGHRRRLRVRRVRDRAFGTHARREALLLGRVARIAGVKKHRLAIDDNDVAVLVLACLQRLAASM